jgi:hypothetical protein
MAKKKTLQNLSEFSSMTAALVAAGYGEKDVENFLKQRRAAGRSSSGKLSEPMWWSEHPTGIEEATTALTNLSALSNHKQGYQVTLGSSEYGAALETVLKALACCFEGAYGTRNNKPSITTIKPAVAFLVHAALNGHTDEVVRVLETLKGLGAVEMLTKDAKGLTVDDALGAFNPGNGWDDIEAPTAPKAPATAPKAPAKPTTLEPLTAEEMEALGDIMVEAKGAKIAEVRKARRAGEAKFRELWADRMKDALDDTRVNLELTTE